MSGAQQWSRAMQVANLFAACPHDLGGIVVRAHAGPVRDLFLSHLRDMMPEKMPFRRLPAQISDDRLLGGLDLAATLRTGHPVSTAGVLAEVSGGVLIAAMAERLTPAVAARLCRVLDTGEIRAEREGLSLHAPCRFGLVALDEGIGDDEQPPPAIPERLAFWIDLEGVRISEALELPRDRDEIAAARALVPSVTLGDDDLAALCETSTALGIASLRPVLLAARAACAAAALDGRSVVLLADVALAGQLVLAPRATRVPQAPPELEPEPEAGQASGESQPSPPESGAQDSAPAPPAQPGGRPLEDVVLEAASAAIPAQVLARLAAGLGQKGRANSQGRAGAARQSTKRGRPIGTRAGDPRQGGRLNLLATLRAAAPMQKLRRAVMAPATPGGILVRHADFRMTKFQQNRQTVTIFAVDASGSSALNRLAEAKGAVELLLAECYVRRDRVALIAFRGKSAELLLPPTASLTRVKKCLASLPGGGGTPLALGIEAAVALADAVRRKGDTPVIVLLTDGQANIARDGTGGRLRAGEDALTAARAARGQHVTAILVDTSRRPDARAQAIADAMGARYLPLPYADARGLAKAVG